MKKINNNNMKMKILLLFILVLYTSSNLLAQATTLSWQITEPVYTLSSNTMQFTVQISQDEADGDSYATALTLALNYNEDAFQNVAIANIVVDPYFYGFTPNGAWSATVVVGGGQLVVTALPGVTPPFVGTPAPIAITPTYMNFCTITFEVNNTCGELAGINFIPGIMVTGSSYNGGTAGPYYTPAYIGGVDEWANHLVYPAPATTTWTGGSTSDWLDIANWSDGFPCTGSDVYIPDVTNYPIMDVDGFCDDITINAGGKLTINSGNTLTVAGEFKVESGPGPDKSGGNGSFINHGNLSPNTATVQSYVTDGQWHGISAPVKGVIASSYWFGGNPEVWLKSYDEYSNTYSNIEELNYELVDMTGYMTWIAVSMPKTYDLAGDLYTSASKVLDFTEEDGPGNGFNFVGNPFSSAIDWDAESGWTKTNVNNAVYVWNDDNWETYIDGTGLPDTFDGKIAMNQGFFVQANASSGALEMNTNVCVHDDVEFKNVTDAGQIIRLQLADANKVDETVVKFVDGATVDLDGNLDAHKMFSFVEDYPQLYSTANDFMAINSLPADYNEAIPMDVVGADGHTMTISVSEAIDFEELYLKDEFTGEVTNLILEDYTFTFNAGVTDRFTLLFDPTDVNETEIQSNVSVFAYGKTIQVNLEEQSQSNITVYNLMGQEVVSLKTSGNQTLIPMHKGGYYIVKVISGNGVTSQKVFTK